jgi:hypothetical protein
VLFKFVEAVAVVFWLALNAKENDMEAVDASSSTHQGYQTGRLMS